MSCILSLTYPFRLSCVRSCDQICYRPNSARHPNDSRIGCLLAPHQARAIHKPHELIESLLIAPERVVHECDHKRLTFCDQLSIFPWLIAIQNLFDADTDQSLRSTRWISRSSLGEARMFRGPSVPNAVIRIWLCRNG